MILTSLDKAQAINNDFGIPAAAGMLPQPGEINYRGAIAEIGAGQEVARLFFEALGSSRTIVKTMSAYGKGCSDAIYGKVPSYISEERLEKMFKHDYRLLLTRSLADDEKPKGQKLRYFTFANTVDINRDGWAAVRIQSTGCALSDKSHFALEFKVHFEILAKDKVAKIKIVGALGINLIHGALLNASENKLSDNGLISALIDNVEPTDLRVDSIGIRKLRVRVDDSSDDQADVHLEEVDEDKYGILSRDLCIELVKTSTVHCASFRKSESAAVPSYTAIDKGKYLALTRSACDLDNLPLESEMLNCAKQAMKEELSTAASPLEDEDIVTAIHLPIVSIHSPDTDLSEQFVYLDLQQEPDDHRQKRSDLMKNTPTDEIAARIERIVNTGNIALLTDYTATSEAIKFLRTKTRLKPGAVTSNCKEIAYVLRTDQLVEFLVNIEKRVKDRDSLEIIGSMVRRKTRLYIYPCSYSRIFEGKTRYGVPIEEAFKRSALNKNRKNRATVEHLKTGLLERYFSLIAYMEAANCIYDLSPGTDEFLDVPLRPQIE